MRTALNNLEPTVLLTIALIALLFVGIAGITHAVFQSSQASSVDRARFLVVALFGSLVAVGAYLPILISRWIDYETSLFRVSTFIYFWLVILGWKILSSYPQISSAIERMHRESQFPRVFTIVLRVIGGIIVLVNVLSWPIDSGQGLYELLLVLTLVNVLLHFVNLVIFRIADNPVLEHPINAGWEAVIYEPPGDQSKVLKLFNFYDYAAADHEVVVTKTAHEAGLPCPEVYGDVVEVEQRFGFYMEKIDGKSFEDQGIYKRSELSEKLSAEFGSFHASLHEIEGVVFPRKFHDVARESIRNAERLSEEEKTEVLDVLEQLPEGDRMYHGDFHPGNVMRRNQDNELVVIDWVRASTGHPLADVARASMILSTAWLEFFPLFRHIVRLAIARYVRNYEEAYFEASGRSPEEIAPWRLVVAAMRMGEAPISKKQTRILARSVRKLLRKRSRLAT